MNAMRIVPMNTDTVEQTQEQTQENILKKYSQNCPNLFWCSENYLPLILSKKIYNLYFNHKPQKKNIMQKSGSIFKIIGCDFTKKDCLTTELNHNGNERKKCNICLFDELIEKNRISIIIDFNVQSYQTNPKSIILKKIISLLNSDDEQNINTVGLFFERDILGRVNLLYSNIINGHKKNIKYKNCIYFGYEKNLTHSYEMQSERTLNTITSKQSYLMETKFIISNEFQDKTIFSGVNFNDSNYSDFCYVIEYINDFIQQSLSNNLPEHMIAYPKLTCINKKNESIIDETNADANYAEIPIISQKNIILEK